VLGLVGAALRIRRDDADVLASLDAALGFASRTDAPGHLLMDFHTAQGPEEALLRKEERSARKAGVPWHRPETRRAELAFRRGDLSTLLSQREYRVDALWTVAIWVPEGASARWSLAHLAAALSQPGFVPYLGRKSCPVDLPLEPQILEAVDPVAAMAAATFRSDPFVAGLIEAGMGRATVRWEGAWPGLMPDQTSRRRDRVLSRARWQFTERQEHERALRASTGGGDVPEQG
jgi:CRISPR system Cascade subunit CasD